MGKLDLRESGGSLEKKGRDFNGDPGILAPRKSLKLTGNPDGTPTS